jgi:hypothetical protein
MAVLFSPLQVVADIDTKTLNRVEKRLVHDMQLFERTLR